MTFEVKRLITSVPTYLLIILTKFRQNPMKHVGGVTFSFKMTFFDLCDPYMTFEVKLLKPCVPTHPLVILTKFGWNQIKHVEEEANCKKIYPKCLECHEGHYLQISTQSEHFWKFDLWPICDPLMTYNRFLNIFNISRRS